METLVGKKTWGIDPAHSEIMFKVKHMMVSTVTGFFDEFEGEVTSEADDFSDAQIRFSAKTQSINTKNSDRDNHLKSDDFFNAADYPEISFSSTAFNRNDEDSFELVGDLTIRDITREVQLEVEYNGQAVDAYGQTKAGFELVDTVDIMETQYILRFKKVETKE